MTKALNADWEFVADTVMGGVSHGRIEQAHISGRPATRLMGEVSLDNNGGFIQMAFDIHENARPFDASEWEAVEIDVFGNDEVYDLRLRTTDLTRPWQSYRGPFLAPGFWSTVRIPFADCKPHKTDIRFNPRRLRRIGILAIGRVFSADVAVSAIRLS